MKRGCVCHRALAAVALVHVNTGAQISEPMLLAGEDRKIVRNRSGYYILLRNRQENDGGDPSQMILAVYDPSGRYLPRRHNLQIEAPEGPDENENSNPMPPSILPLYPAPTARSLPGLTEVRTLVRDTEQNPVPGALVTVTTLTADPSITVVSRGMCAWWGRSSGETLVDVPGVPLSIPSTETTGAMATDQIPVAVRVYADPHFPATAEAVPDPAAIESPPYLLPIIGPGGEGGEPITLQARKMNRVSVTVQLPPI